MDAPELKSNWRWNDGDVEPSAAVVFDIDGVLSDAVGRQHFLERGRRDWNAFLDPALQVILLTGRPLRVRPLTLAWLERYGLRWALLIMRDWGDYSYVTSFKRSVVEELRAAGFDLRLALEDDPQNHAMYVAEGIPCVYIHSGYYED